MIVMDKPFVCHRCGVTVKRVRFPVRCACGTISYAHDQDQATHKLRQLEIAYREGICSECPRHMTNGGCRDVKLGCRNSLVSYRRNPDAACPNGHWSEVKEAYSGVIRQRQNTCHKCVEYVNGVCRELGDAHVEALRRNSPLCPLGKWVAQWTPPDDTIAPPTSDRLIITIAVGPRFEELLEITGPAIERYAQRCSADYVALTNATQNWWGLEKFRVYPFAKRYKRTLFIDADVLLLEKSPNLFDIVPEGHVAMHDDYPHLKWKPWMHYERTIMADTQGVDIPDPDQAWNTGIVMCDQHQADIWHPPEKPFQAAHCCEQLWIEYQAMKYPFFELDSSLNCQYWFNDYYLRLPEAKILHLSNCPHETRMMSARQLLTW